MIFHKNVEDRLLFGFFKNDPLVDLFISILPHQSERYSRVIDSIS